MLFSMKALVTANFTEQGLERLRSHMEVVYEPWGLTGKLILSDDMAEKLKQLSADVLILEVDLCHEEVFEECKMSLVGCCRGDPLNVDVETATEQGVPVFYTPGRNADAVADLTLGFMLCQARQIIPINNMLLSGNFNPDDPDQFMKMYKDMKGFELRGKTVGIVGMGAIGRGVARRLKAFGSRILASDPFVEPAVFDELSAEKVELEELFSKSDFVTLHAAATDDNQGLITRDLIEMMKPSAFFLNLARTELVDQDALYEALKEKRIAGAALDVFYTEPPQKDDRMLGLGNVIATPHIGGNTEDVIRHQTDMIMHDVEAWLKNDKPRHIINPEVLGKKS